MGTEERTGKRPDSAKRGITLSIAVIGVVLFVTLAVLKPAMPDRIRLLTGAKGSAYHALGNRYAVELRRRGLEVDVIVTRGDQENIERLVAGGDDLVAFAPSTVGDQVDRELDSVDLVSLGSVAFDPIWLFHGSELEIEQIPDLAGLVVGTAGEGSGSHRVARRLLEQNGIADSVELRPLDGSSVKRLAEPLYEGSVEAAFVQGAPSSPLVRALLESDDLSFLSFDRAAAYAARIPGITTLTVPEGVFDLGRNVPPDEARLLSAATNLVASQGLQPAVGPLLLDVVSSLPEASGYFSPSVAFPSEKNLAFPLDRASKRYFRQGQTGLSKYLPYRVARQLNHLGFVVLPLLGLTMLLLKLVPKGLKIWGQLRLTGLLKQLEAVEKGQASGVDRSKLLDDLDRIDRASAKLFVPRSTVHDYIDFRQFLHDMRERVAGG